MMELPDGEFVHRFVHAKEGPGRTETIVLLHGTGGSENDLVDLGRTLRPGAALLSPRGKVLERGMPRFFRRLSEGVFDLEDLVARTHELAEFVEDAMVEHGRDPSQVFAVGYSNGANIGAAMMLLRPHVLAGAALFHAMVPLTPEFAPDLLGRRVFLSAGRTDPTVPMENSKQLATMLERYGASVELHLEDGGHQLEMTEVHAAKKWMEG